MYIPSPESVSISSNVSFTATAVLATATPTSTSTSIHIEGIATGLGLSQAEIIGMVIAGFFLITLCIASYYCVPWNKVRQRAGSKEEKDPAAREVERVEAGWNDGLYRATNR